MSQPVTSCSSALYVSVCDLIDIEVGKWRHDYVALMLGFGL